MSRSTLFIVILIAAALVLSACDAILVPVPTPTVTLEAPTQTALPTQTPVPTLEVTSLPALPICESGVACAAPVVEVRDRFCAEKVPYTLLAAPGGSTYEWADSNLTCVNQLHSSGELLITCTGTELTSYELRVCNGACAPPTAVNDGQCPQGYGFDAAAQCCVPPQSPACVIVRVDIGTCSQ
ncbi:MAG: hypothetical protein ACOYZ8_07880 [Chloroflexota bacterium]